MARTPNYTGVIVCDEPNRTLRETGPENDTKTKKQSITYIRSVPVLPRSRDKIISQQHYHYLVTSKKRVEKSIFLLSSSTLHPRNTTIL